LHAFGAGNDGGGLWSSVSLDKKGNLYGATSGGGDYGYGTVFKLTLGANGNWAETILHSFKNGDPLGSEPNGGLIQNEAGNWYGTANRDGAHHAGTVFELTHGSGGWTVSVLYAFGDQSGDSGFPTAGLVMDKAGNLYGTAPNGGDVFELTRSYGGWNETVLHRFGIRKGDGAAPFAGLILDASGSLYGTTLGGGMGCAGEGCGTVFELTPTSSGGWKELVLHRFDNNGKDGATPGNGALMMDGSGNLYGTTEVGGAGRWGTVFKLTSAAGGRWKETILYGFKDDASGGFPAAGVIMDKAGNLYGTTVYGGSTSCGCGVIYKLAPGPNGKWIYTVLHTFVGNDGAVPEGNLILDNKGNLYGGTLLGGTAGNGVIFEITP
jgi:uncharacterized repeat protein (TIGR03803 family)